MKNKRRECKRAAAMLLAALMVVNSVDLSAFTAYAAQAELVPEKTEQSASSKECVMTITDFEELEEDVMQQLLPVGTSEEEIIFPDTLNVTVSVSDTQEEGVSEGKSESKETVSGNDVSESEKEEAGTVGETESETGEHESETPESEEGNVSDSQAEENEETDNTETASIFQTILSAFAPMTVYAAWEQATNDGEETAQTKKVTLTGVTWEIDPAESDGEVFDSCEDCDGYCYVYTPVLPETDEDGNKVTLGDNVEAPVIYVLIGEDENHVSAIAEEGYDDDGFCTAWEWVDGTLKKKDGATCSHTDCNGYEKPEWNSLEGYYEISNAGELYWFADYINQHPANEGENAKLMRDITVNKDLTTKILDSNGNVKESQSVRKWIPIGKAYEKTSSTNSGIVVDGSFRATFDGDEHTISGIYYSNPGCAYGTGLFGTLCEGTISNLTLKDSYIEDTDKSNKNGRIAGICGLNDEGTITNCINVGGIVKGTKAVGGICGINQGTISSCTNSSKVTATSHNAGGICGQNSGSSAEITNCTNESGGTIDGNSYVGGICGDNGGSVENCENNGGVSGTGNDVGGICGDNGGSVENCENKGSVTGTGEFVGGICGLHSGSGAIVSCKNVGAEVKGVKSVGGICGRVTYFDKQNQTVHTLVKECANSGSVTGTGENVGGVCGYLYFCAGITDICNTGTVSGKGLVGGIAGVLSGGDTIQNAYNAGRVTATNSSNAGVIYGKDEKGDATEENCYYLATIKSDGVQDNGGTSMTAEEFSSGKVAWLLNGSDTTGTTWRQNIDSGTKDDYPVLDGEHGTVYQCTPCKGAYSNSQEPKAHDFQKCENDSTKHVCANCEETEAHTPIYTADNSTHTISGECACGIVFGSVTLSAPTGTLTYDGTEKAATVTGSISGVTETPTISYVKVENKTETSLTEDDKPTDAGTYKASITCGSGDHTATVSVTYTIEQATPTIKTTPKVEGTIYDLTKKLSTISLTGGTVTGVNNVTLEGQWSWETPDQSLDINKTDYKATFTPTGTTNYKTVTCNVTITVEKATPTVTWSDTNKTVYYTGKTISSDKLPALTVTGVDNTDIKNIYETDDITYFYRESDGESSTGAFTKGLPTNVGTYDIKATVKEKGNYTGAETTEDNYLTLKIDWLETDATATLTDQNGKSLTDDDWAKSVTFTAPEGYTISFDEKDAYGSCFSFSNHETDTGSDGISYTYYLKNSDGEIAKTTQTVRIDRTAPTFPENGGITIGDTGTWWKSLLNTITFGLVYRNTVEVKVCGTDALSGVDKYYYYIDDSGNTTPKTASELAGLDFQSVNAGGSNAVTVKNLANTGETKNYVVYAYAVDKAGNRSAYICSNGVVVDAEAPMLTLFTPTKDDETLTDSSATVTLDASEAGTYFYILKKDGEAAPSDMDDFATETSTNGKTTWTAKEGITSGSMAEGNNTITLTALDANTKYTLYVVAVDSVGNATENVQSKAFTTLKLNPTITVQPKITGTYGQKLSEMNLTDGTAAYNDTSVAGAWEITDTKKATAYPTVNGTTAYEVTFKPADAKYAEVTVDVIPTVEKGTPHIAADPTATAITYGQTLSLSTLANGKVQYSASNTQTVEGCFVWKDGSSKPTAKDDSNKTYYTVIFKPTDSANWNEAETQIKITVNKAQNAPNTPGSTMSVKTSITKVGDVTLPSGWAWKDQQIEEYQLEIGVSVTMTARYEGADLGNYVNEMVNITITRSNCDHVPGEILYAGTGEHAPDCVNDGLGHRECTKCHEITESGIVVPALGHQGGTATCNKRAVCDNCHQEYGSTNPNNHAATEVRGHKNADCTSAGYTGDTHCVYCGKMLQSGTVIAALGHDYKNEVTTEPTTTSTGVRTYTCKRCGYSYTETIAKLANSGDKPGNDNQQDNTDKPGSNNQQDNTHKPGSNNQQDNTHKPGSNNQQDNTDKPGDTGKPDTGKPYIEGRADKNGWENIKDQLADAKEKDTVTVDMNGTTVVPGDVFDTIRGKDVNVVFDMGDGITWTVNGKDITADKVGDIDFGVTVGSQAGKTIPVDIINNVTGERYSMNVSLAYDGEFGFKATLSLNVGRENAGLYANLFYYNPETNSLEYMSAGIIDEEGNAHLDFTHASDYSIVIDTEDMKTADTGSASTVPATADGTDAWNPWWIIIIGAVILIVGIGVFFVAKKKRETEE